MKISKRLKTIANIVNAKIICDVGCDHGKLTYYLLKNKLVDFAYISDISINSLNKAIKLLSDNDLSFEAICTDGLKDYKKNFNIDECIISGMGGFEIINIIKNSPISIDSFILSPQHNIIETKKFMIEHNYKIVFDIIIEDKNKFYNIFKCKKSQTKIKYGEFQLLFGKDNFINKDSDLKKYIDYRLNKINSILNKVDASEKLNLQAEVNLLNIAKKELESNE